jgi:acetylornithine deacetylase
MTQVATLLAELIGIDTHNPGGDELALASLLARKLEAHAPSELRVIETVNPEHRRGASVYARFGDSPRLLVNAHIDTVPPSEGWSGPPFMARTAGDRLIGLGAADTKGAIAAILCALDEARPKDVALLFSGDEEKSGTCMRAFVQSTLAQGLERAIVCEPTSCRVGTRHRGILAFEITFVGEGGHSSRSDILPAPLLELARLAVRLGEWGVARRTVGPVDFPGMCLNVAKLDGGVAFNVVPEKATLCLSLRPPPGADLAEIKGELEALATRIVPGAAMTCVLDNPPFATRDRHAFGPLLGAAVETPIDMGFWTEAAVLSAIGIDAVVYGPGDIAQAHAVDEWVALGDLETARLAFARAFRQTSAHGTR